MSDSARSASHGCLFRVARPDDAAAIVSVFRAAMPSAIVSLNVLGTPKAARFVDRSIVAAASAGSDRYWVAEDEQGHVIAFAQLRLGRRITFINNIHVLPSYQGMGVGDRLMRLMSAAVTSSEVCADVFDGSTTSAGMFERAGFRRSGTYRWHILEADERQPDPYVVHDLPQADIAHDAFDLSMIRVETDTMIHSVGRIGARLFRLVGGAALGDPSLLPALATIDPARSVLAIVSEEEDALDEPCVLVGRRLLARQADLAAKYG